MANIIEYVAQLKDNVSSVLSKIAANSDKVQNTVNKNSEKSEKGFMKIASAISVAALAYKAFDLGKQLVQAGAEMEQTRIKFETFTGSIEKGNKMIADLQKFSLDTPFDDNQVIKAGQSLLAFGFGQDEVISKLKMLGNISSATGKDFNELSVIYGKNKVAGVAMAEDISQYTEAGVSVIQEVAKVLKVSEQQVKKLGSEGKITFQVLDKALQNLGGTTGKWGSLMDKQSKTIGGRWSSLVGTIQNMSAALGESLNPFIGKVLDNINTFVGYIKDNTNNIKKMFEPLVTALTPFFTKLSNAFKMLNSEGSTLDSIFNRIASVISYISPVLEVIADVAGSVIETVARIVKSFQDFYQRHEWLQKLVGGFWEGFIAVLKQIGSLAKNVLGGIADSIEGIFSGDFSKFKSGFEKLTTGLVKDAALTGHKFFDGFSDGWIAGAKKTNLFGNNSVVNTSDLEGYYAVKDGNGGLTNKLGGSYNNSSNESLKNDVSGVSSQKPTNIYVSISKVVGVETLIVDKIEKGLSKLETELKDILLSSVNDVALLKD